MKKIVSLFFVLSGIVLMLVSCSNDEVMTDEIKQKSECKTLLELKEFNQKFVSSNQTRGWFDTFLEVASCDILGAAAGITAGKTIIGLAGVATGGTGAFVAGAVCGSICGAAASNKAYGYSRNTRVLSDSTIDDVGFLIVAEKTYKSNLVRCDTSQFGCIGERYVYNKAFEKIQIPEEFEYVKRVGEDHNGMVLSALSIAKDNVSAQDLPLEYFRGIVPSVELTTTQLDKVVFDNPDFTYKYAKINQCIEACLENGGLNIDKFFNQYPLVSNRVEQALKDYILLFNSYPSSVDEVAEITNGYIDIIEKNNEFTNDEKEVIYAAVTVALYSPQIWNGFE